MIKTTGVVGVILTVCFIALIASGCNSIKFPILDTNTPLFDPIPSQTYLTQVKPLVTVIDISFGPEMTEHQYEVFQTAVADLDKQASEGDTVNIINAAVAAATPILLSEKLKLDITPRDATIALIGLETLKAFHNSDDDDLPFVESVYPVLRGILIESGAAPLRENSIQK